MMKSSNTNQANQLALNYVEWMYETPFSEQKASNEPKLSNLLEKAKIIFISNGEEASLTTTELIDNLQQNYHNTSNKITEVTQKLISNGLTPRVEVRSVHTWKEDDLFRPQKYTIYSGINFTTAKDPTTGQLYITRVEHQDNIYEEEAPYKD